MQFESEPFFHVLNRGVDKRTVFENKTDYLRFIHNLYEFNDVQSTRNMNSYYFKKNRSLDVGRLNFGERRKERESLVNIHFFALMPNHYHLLISPRVENGVSQFMKKLNGGYTKYFNEKNGRSGTLWQGGYKSVHIETERHFLFIPYYIHFNPLDLHAPQWRTRSIVNNQKARQFLETYRWSSHLDYLGKDNFPSITERSFFFDLFKGPEGYAKSVTAELKNFSVEGMENIMLESEN